MSDADGIVLLVQLRDGEVVAVPFSSRDRADQWEDRHDFETVGRPRVVSARSLSVGERLSKLEKTGHAGR